MDYTENKGRRYLTSTDFMQMSPVVRLCFHGTKQFFPQDTWRETDYPVIKIDAAVYEDSDNESCLRWAQVIDRYLELPPSGV